MRPYCPSAADAARARSRPPAQHAVRGHGRAARRARAAARRRPAVTSRTVRSETLGGAPYLLADVADGAAAPTARPARRGERGVRVPARSLGVPPRPLLRPLAPRGRTAHPARAGRGAALPGQDERGLHARSAEPRDLRGGVRASRARGSGSSSPSPAAGRRSSRAGRGPRRVRHRATRQDVETTAVVRAASSAGRHGSRTASCAAGRACAAFTLELGPRDDPRTARAGRGRRPRGRRRCCGRSRAARASTRSPPICRTGSSTTATAQTLLAEALPAWERLLHPRRRGRARLGRDAAPARDAGRRARARAPAAARARRGALRRARAPRRPRDPRARRRSSPRAAGL